MVTRCCVANLYFSSIFVLLLSFWRSHVCVFLHSLRLQTAAHCILNPKITAITIRFESDSEVRRVRAKSWVTHPSYDPDSAVNDIGLIRLAQTVPRSAFKPIAIRFFAGFPQPGRVTSVIGVGYTSQEGPLSDDLRQVRLRVRDGAVCDEVFANFKESIEICAGGLGKVCHTSAVFARFRCSSRFDSLSSPRMPPSALGPMFR